MRMIPTRPFFIQGIGLSLLLLVSGPKKIAEDNFADSYTKVIGLLSS